MDERAPLLQFPGSFAGSMRGGPSVSGDLGDHHAQFCHLVGVRPLNHPPGQSHKPHPDSLYARAVKHKRAQSCTYAFTATMVNALLLTQIMLGAALTGLGASNSSRVLITVFGATNTVIAGVIAFLKSRGQPVRARMFRDDLERVVDEIENSATMWYGVSRGAHGYDALDIDDEVTVRGEVARLTRLYDKAVKTNTMNDPDMYSAGTGDSHNAALRKAPPGPLAAAAPASSGAVLAVDAPAIPAVDAAPAPPAEDPDASPASKAPEPTKPKDDDKDKDGDKGKDVPADDTKPGTEDKKDEPPKEDAAKAEDKPTNPTPLPPPPPAADPDESPATSAILRKKDDSKDDSKKDDSKPSGSDSKAQPNGPSS